MKSGVGKLGHVLDACQEAVELAQLVFEQAHFFLGQDLEHAGVALTFQFTQPLDALLDRLEICERAAEPALVDVEHPRAVSFFFDDFLRLLLGADEQEGLVLARHLFDDAVDLAQLEHGLLKIDDVDAVALLEDVLGHLRVPTARLMPEVDARFEQLFHGDDGRHSKASL